MGAGSSTRNRRVVVILFVCLRKKVFFFFGFSFSPRICHGNACSSGAKRDLFFGIPRIPWEGNVRSSGAKTWP